MVVDLYKGPDIPSDVTSDVVTFGGISIREIAGQEGTDAAGSSKASRTWLLKGSSSPITCRSALLHGPVLINTYDGLFIESLSRERVADDAWEFTAEYNSAVPDVGGWTLSIDTTGAQILQTSGYSEQKFVASGFSGAPDFKNAIDVQNGKPQGVQRVIPALKLNFTAKIATEYVPSVIGYAKLLSRLTGTTNTATMFGEFAAGELLFAGASGQVVAENPQLTFTFLASENVSDLTIGDITGISKKGHEYQWYYFAPDKDTTTKLQIARPRATYVNRIYGEADHGLMKIGVAATS